MSSITITGDFEPDPNEEDLWEQLLPMEIHPRHGIVFRYYTAEERSKREQRYKKIERLMGPQPERPKPKKDDAYYALYESDMYEGPKTPTLDADPSLTERELEPIILTQEEEEFYNGPAVSKERKFGDFHPFLKGKEKVSEQNLGASTSNPKVLKPPKHGLVASTSTSRVPTPLLEARLKGRVRIPPAAEPSESDLVKDYVQWRLEVLRGQGGTPRPTDPQPSEGQGNRIECEEDFRFKPGDIFLFLELRTQDKGETPCVRSYINVHKDVNYFEDHGQYRLNFMDTYGPLYDGDMVLRFGNFNKAYHWRQHPSINFYVYYSNVKPSESDGNTSLHPWYWIEQLQVPQPVVNHQRSRGIDEPRAAENMPIGTLMPWFRLRDGDVLMTYIWDTKDLRFDRMKTYIWNPLLENIGVHRFVNDHDRLLRYGVRYEDIPCQTTTGRRYIVTIVEIEAELYCFRNSSIWHKNWIFLGRSTQRFFDHLLHGSLRFDKVKKLGQVPIAGDVLFERGLRFTLDPDPTKREGPPRRWFPDLKIGGLVSFYRWEFLKDYGREPRPFFHLKDTGKYGVPNTTMALRFGKFNDPKGAAEDTSNWTWQERKTVELFVLNTRGSSWRRAVVQIWPDELPHPIPNYYWEPTNIHDITEPSPWFEPRPGDVIIRLNTSQEWLSLKSNPTLVGNTYNPHYDVDIQMGIWGPNLMDAKKGDFLVRAGYEKNEINPSWTNATVELYYHEGEDNSPLPWKFRGRDAYIFGTNYWQGGLKGVQQSGFGRLRVIDIEKLNSFDRRKFLQLDPSDIWREPSWREIP